MRTTSYLRAHAREVGSWDFQWIRKRAVLTTRTSVAAGHDQFDRGLILRVALNATFFNTHRMVRPYLLHSKALGDET